MSRRYGNDIITDEIWLVVTVNKRSTNFRILYKEPKTLAPNEYGYKLIIKTNFKIWEDRISSINLPSMEPSRPVTLDVGMRDIGESIEDRVTRKLTQ